MTKIRGHSLQDFMLHCLLDITRCLQEHNTEIHRDLLLTYMSFGVESRVASVLPVDQVVRL